MKFWKSVLPNLTIGLNLALMIVIYLDMRNPMMGFLIGTPFAVLALSCVVCSIVTAAVFYGISRREKKQKTEDLPGKQ